jgi:hypothetical protein
MSDDRFSKSELKVRAIAKRRANAQLLHVPWPRFRKAYEEYPRWQALALWIQAVSATQDSVPSWLMDGLRKRCPGFIEHKAASRGPKVTGLNLLEWAHNHKFASAKQQGWLDALTFYGVRHPRSQAAWAYWERCEEEWNRQPPSRYPHFEEWLRSAMKYSAADLVGVVDRYVEWSMFSLWFEPLIRADAELPKHIAKEVRRRWPEILDLKSSNSTRGNYKNRQAGRRLVTWFEGRYFADAKKDGLIQVIRRHVTAHPLFARTVQYSKHPAKIFAQDLAKYPSYARWRRIVENYKEE